MLGLLWTLGAPMVDLVLKTMVLNPIPPIKRLPKGAPLFGPLPLAHYYMTLWCWQCKGVTWPVLFHCSCVYIHCWPIVVLLTNLVISWKDFCSEFVKRSQNTQHWPQCVCAWFVCWECLVQSAEITQKSHGSQLDLVEVLTRAMGVIEKMKCPLIHHRRSPGGQAGFVVVC